jgi:hypothetical protein
VNVNCFAFPAYNPVTGLTHLGTAGRNSIIGPSLTDFDTSLVKNTRVPKISESFNIQFRAELFNVANHVNYATPPKAGTQLFNGSGVLQPNGTILAGAPLATGGVLVGPTASSARQAQFAVKVLF